MNINKSLFNIIEFCSVLKNPNISNKVIIKWYSLLWNKIKKALYKIWQRAPFALEPQIKVILELKYMKLL